MDARRIERIERGAELVGAAAFAAAVAYAALRFGPIPAAVAGAVAFFAMFQILGRVGADVPTFALDHFEASELPPAVEPEELLLTEVHEPEAEELLLDDVFTESDAVLVLEDVLARLGENSRVIRLFDPAAMPTPGEMQSRIDRHLEDAPERNAEASKALHEALSDLRKSLR